MIRRVLNTLLVVTLVASALPSAAFADEPTPPLATARSPQVSISAQPAHAFDLQKSTQGVVLEQSKSARQENGPFLKTGAGKATLAAVLLAASIVICYRMAQGPDPTSANAR